jgi:hypothetical protein
LIAFPDVGRYERLVVDLGNRLLRNDLEQRGGRVLPHLGVDRPEHGVPRQYNLLGRKRDEGPA